MMKCNLQKLNHCAVHLKLTHTILQSKINMMILALLGVSVLFGPSSDFLTLTFLITGYLLENPTKIFMLCNTLVWHLSPK